MIACQSGLKPFEVDAMDLVDVLLHIEGYDRRERCKWERARLIGYSVHAHSMAKKRAKTPEKWLPFSWDKKSVQRSIEDAREFYNRRREEIKKVLNNGG